MCKIWVLMFILYGGKEHFSGAFGQWDLLFHTSWELSILPRYSTIYESVPFTVTFYSWRLIISLQIKSDELLCQMIILMCYSFGMCHFQHNWTQQLNTRKSHWNWISTIFYITLSRCYVYIWMIMARVNIIR